MVRKFLVLAAAGAALVFGSTVAVAAGPAASKAIADAVANPARPAADTARDADRKPADVLAFAGVKAGQNVGEFIPGGGYYTRLLSSVVGTTGHVYALWPEGLAKARPQIVQASASIGPNVSVLTFGSGPLPVPEKLDLVWTSENYHDFHNAPPGAPPADIAAFNKSVFDALKPGGIYLIEDHAAAAGAGPGVTNTLHRIDPGQAKTEVEAAGFKLVGESSLLANSADAHTAPVFDPSIRGHTDKMLLKFRKP